MNKADLISAVAAEAGLSKVDAKKAVEAFRFNCNKGPPRRGQSIINRIRNILCC